MNITNEKVTDYINSLYRPLTEELALLRAEGEKRHIPIILRDSRQCSWSDRDEQTGKDPGDRNGHRLFGGRIWHCLQAGLDTKIITVEIDPLYAGDARKNLAGLRNVRLIRGDACKVMNEWGSDRQVIFDMIFIDAAKSHYREFWDEAVKLTHPGSVIVCDNILMQARTADESYDERGRFTTNIKYMREFLNYIASYEGAVTSILPVGDGMSISVIR